tara:strand:- start:16248 stop:16946 length:699 start_codon:yes stop_codon:yes gene_type:complete
MITKIYNFILAQFFPNLKAVFRYNNSHHKQKKWTKIAIKKYQKQGSYSWGKAIEDEKNLGNYVKVRDEILIPNCLNKAVLELGCLDGKWSQYIIPKAMHTTLVDLSEDIIPILENRMKNVNVNKKFTFYATKGYELDGVQDDTIDLIFSIDTLVRVKKRYLEKYFSEFRRVLKKDGKMILHLPCTASKMSKHKKFVFLSPTNITNYMYNNSFKKFKLDFETINHGVLLLYGF